MVRVLGRGLALVAIGEKKQPDTSAQAPSGLIVDQEGSTEARRADLARTQTIPGAISALRRDLGNDEDLKQALWSAVK